MSNQTEDWKIIDWAASNPWNKRHPWYGYEQPISALSRRIQELEARIDMLQEHATPHAITTSSKLLIQRDNLLEHIHGNEHSEPMSTCQKCARLLEDTD